MGKRLVAGLLAVAGASGSSSSTPPGAETESATSADFEWVEVTYGAANPGRRGGLQAGGLLQFGEPPADSPPFHGGEERRG